MANRPEVIAGVEDVDLSDATVLVTGATDGIGRETAVSLGRLGAFVLVHGRDPAKADRVVSAVESAGGEAEAVLAEYLEERAVLDLAESVLDRTATLDVLVNNAGATFATGELNGAGVERTMAVNHVAPFVLTNRLAPAVERAGGRIVTVASGVHRRVEMDFAAFDDVRAYDAFDAYSYSKYANVLFTYALARRLADATANCLHPGFVPGSALWRGGRPLIRWSLRLLGSLPGFVQNRFGKTPAVAAATPVYLAASPEVANVTAEYFSDCQRTRSADGTYDESLQEALWEQTLEYTSVEDDRLLSLVD
jgi:NAD(P)-dependent dehydrogenase (short-subunit alcohol dehydrogenase family)